MKYKFKTCEWKVEKNPSGCEIHRYVCNRFYFNVLLLSPFFIFASL